MRDYKSNTITTTNTPFTEEEINKYTADMNSILNDISINSITTRTIHDDYINCPRCFTTFLIFELIEKYHEVLRSSYQYIKPYLVLKNRINEFIKTYENFNTDCRCCIKEEVDWIHQDKGTIFLVGGDEWKTTLFQHYSRLVTEPNVLNEELYWPYEYEQGEDEYYTLDDYHLNIIFNEHDTIIPYMGKNTIYNNRQQYRLKNRNFLKLILHTITSNDGTTKTFAELYRDKDAILQEFRFWKTYFDNSHEYLLVSILSLYKTNLNNDCIYNIIKFLK